MVMNLPARFERGSFIHSPFNPSYALLFSAELFRERHVELQSAESKQVGHSGRCWEVNDPGGWRLRSKIGRL